MHKPTKKESYELSVIKQCITGLENLMSASYEELEQSTFINEESKNKIKETISHSHHRIKSIIRIQAQSMGLDYFTVLQLIYGDDEN